MRAIILVALTALTATVGGCYFHGHHGGPVHYGGGVVIPAGHYHDATCGHYRYRGDWYHSSGHTHGNGCGHTYRGGHWSRGY